MGWIRAVIDSLTGKQLTAPICPTCGEVDKAELRVEVERLQAAIRKMARQVKRASLACREAGLDPSVESLELIAKKLRTLTPEQPSAACPFCGAVRVFVQVRPCEDCEHLRKAIRKCRAWDCQAAYEGPGPCNCEPCKRFYRRAEAWGGDYVSIPDDAPLDMTGDIDLRIKVGGENDAAT